MSTARGFQRKWPRFTLPQTDVEPEKGPYKDYGLSFESKPPGHCRLVYGGGVGFRGLLPCGSSLKIS